MSPPSDIKSLNDPDGGGYVTLTIPSGNDVGVRIRNAGYTAKLRRSGTDVAPALSCTVTLNENPVTVEMDELLTVPLMTPVEGLSIIPGGSVPLLIAQLL
jgi:hypothetical protein